MVVVRAFVELIHGLATFKIAAREQAGLLKLSEHAVYRGQANVGALIKQHTVNILCGHVPLLACLENLHDFQAGQRGFEACAFEFVERGHSDFE